MLVVFNVAIILLVLLIAYWWANQGFFSALLHLLCVVIAGAVALGIWEPLVVNFILRDTWFDRYAWGVVLVTVFAVTLFALRVAFDKLVPSNVELPPWANLVFGFGLGTCSGILSVGLLVIGIGFIQATPTLVGYRGYGRSQRGEVVKYNESMWLPVHELTNTFYGWLSVTSLLSPQPMQHYSPRLHWQSSLMRDAFSDGRGEITMPPDAIQVVGTYYEPGSNQAAVEMRFLAEAMDYGEQLTLSASQVRLISAPRGKRPADVAHPQRWVHDGTVYLYDDLSHYATSTPGQERADIVFVFDKLPVGFVPKFIQVKGLRYTLPRPQGPVPATLTSLGEQTTADVAVDTGAQPIPEDDIVVSNSIRPVRTSTNFLSGMEAQDRHLVEGFGSFSGAPLDISPKLVIQGVYEPKGTRIVMLDVSRGKPTDVYAQSLRARIPENAPLRLVDAGGNIYSPIGYIHEKGGETDIKLDPGSYLRTLSELPHLPTAGTQRLRLYFRVTEGVTIVAFKVGDETLGTTNLVVEGR